MSEKIRNFKDLKVWQKGIEIVEDVYSATKGYPRSEVYSLSSQMRRCAVSIPSNIAEGFKRQHSKEFKQFLYISLGSNAELETQVVISLRMGYLSNEAAEELEGKLDHLSRMTRALIRTLR